MPIRTTVFSKWRAFGFLMGIIVITGLVYQSLWWLFGDVTTAKAVPFSYYDKNPPNDKSRIQASYHVRNVMYQEIFIKESFISKDSTFLLRYLPFAPKICRPNTFIGNWGYLIVFWILSLFVLLAVFFRNDILKKNVRFIIQNQKPFFKISNQD